MTLQAHPTHDRPRPEGVRSTAAGGGLPRAAAWAAVTGGLLLLVVFAVALPPDPAESHSRLWVPTQAAHCLAFLLMVLGLPAVAASFGPDLRRTGLLGYVALQTQLVLSFGSHVYLMWVVPILEQDRVALGAQIDGQDSPLHKYYTTHDLSVGLVLGIGMTGLAVTLWRCGPDMRVIAAVYTLGPVGEVLQLGPFGLIPLAVVVAWLGARVAVRGSVRTPLRVRRPG